MRILNNLVGVDNDNCNINSGSKLKKIAKFILSAKEKNLTTNKVWLSRLFDKNRICYTSDYNNESHYRFRTETSKDIFKQQLFTLIDVFNRKYEKDWDIHLKPTMIAGQICYHLSFMIRYQQIPITNTPGHLRELDELIVLLPLTWNSGDKCLHVSNVIGTRYSLQHDEWKSNYMHSHLGTHGVSSYSDVGYMKDFCMGHTELSELKMEMDSAFDEHQFELFLYTLDSYVSWESLEGGPHISMDKIVLNTASRKMNTNPGEMSTLFTKMNTVLRNNGISSLPINFIFTQGRYRVKYDKVFEDFLKDSFMKYASLEEHLDLVLCKKSVDGNYYKRPESGRSNPIDTLANIKASYNELPFIYIQGEKIEFSITNIQNNQTFDISEYIIYPKFLKYVSEQYECEIYKKCVRGSAINHIHHSSNYVRSNSEQN